jgi:hypothetical protein
MEFWRIIGGMILVISLLEKGGTLIQLEELRNFVLLIVVLGEVFIAE